MMHHHCSPHCAVVSTTDKLGKSWLEKGVHILCTGYTYQGKDFSSPLCPVYSHTHTKLNASIRQTECRNVLLQLTLHLLCVYHFKTSGNTNVDT